MVVGGGGGGKEKEPRTLLVAEFWLIRGLFYFFLLHLIDLLFGHVLASVCEAQLYPWVETILHRNFLKLCDHLCMYFVLKLVAAKFRNTWPRNVFKGTVGFIDQ